MSQIIIIDSAEALAEQIEQTYLHHGSMKIKQAILACLHPIEVPSDAERLAKAVEAAIKPSYIESPNGRGGVMIISKDYSDAAALITARERVVPRAMLLELYGIAIEILGVPWMVGMPTHVKQFSEKAVAIAKKFGYRAE